MGYGQVISKNFSAGGTMGGDLTLDGDLVVNGDGSGNYDEIVNGNLTVSSTNKLVLGGDGSDSYIFESAADKLDLYAGGVQMLQLLEGGTDYVWSPVDDTIFAMGADKDLQISISSDNVIISNATSDGDILIKGNDGGSTITALTLDMGAAGNASFSADVTVGALLKMPDVTAGKILVGDNTSYQEVAVSGDATLASGGGVTLASTNTNLTTLANVTTVGDLDAGSITDGFTSIDVGSGAITTTGTVTGGQLTVDDVTVNGKVVTMTGSANDTAVFTAGTNGTLSIVTTDTAAAAGNIQITADGTVDIDSAGALTLDSGAGINLEPASGSAILLDGIISIDAGVVAPVATAHDTAGTAISISSGSTTAGTTSDIAGGSLTFKGGQGKGSGAGGDIIFQTANAGSSGSTLNSLATALTLSDDLSATFTGSIDLAGSIDVDGTANLDNTDIDGTLVVDGTNISLDSSSTLNIDNSNTSNGVTIGTATSGMPVSIGHSTSETTVNDNLNVTGILDVTDTTDSSDYTGDTGALRVEGGASIAKKVFVGTDLAVEGTSNLDAVDIDGAVQIDNTVSVGVNDTGYDVKFFGAAAGSYMLWDEDQNTLEVSGTIQTADLVLNNDRGHYKIVEEEDYLSIKNEKTGKLYKLWY